MQECSLQAAHSTDDSTIKYLRKIMPLCFIPAQRVTQIFRRLLREATTNTLTPLLQHINHTWIMCDIWPSAAWSVYYKSVRMNNDLKGWHNRLNARGRAQMNLYILVSLLHDESGMIPIQVRLVSEGKLQRHQKKMFVNLQCKIFACWEEFENGDRSPE